MELAGRDNWQESIELQPARNTEGKGFFEDGTAGLLRCSADNEARHPGHPTVFSACLVAKSRTLWIKWISSDLSFIRGA